MISPLVAALARAARGAVAPAAWLGAGAGIAFAVALAAALGALGFLAAGCYLALRDAVPLSGMEAAFATAGVLVLIAAVAVLVLRRALFGRPVSQQPSVTDEAQRALGALQAEAAAAVRTRPGASLLACVLAGILVGALRDRDRR